MSIFGLVDFFERQSLNSQLSTRAAKLIQQVAAAGGDHQLKLAN